jgi:CDP-diacylglycerol--glycerol-3-phosphate 3-phosphatidyltransferase
MGKIKKNLKKAKKEIKEKTEEIKEKTEEQIKNIPNLLTLIRVIITFVIFYLIFAEFSFTAIAILFVIGMITDGLDGYIARHYNQMTEFGRKFDMVADRFLLIGTIGAIVTYNLYVGYFNRFELLLIFLILSREIISFPFAIAAFFSGKLLPQVRKIGKLTTVLQAISFPFVLLKLDFAVYFVVLTAAVGIIAGMAYVYDTQRIVK